MTNIEQLKKETDEIKKWLSELKNNVSLSEVEKKNKAEALKNQAEATKKKIENEIHSLESKTDDESKKKKEEAETLLNSFNEIMSLYNSILNNWRESTSQVVITETAQLPTTEQQEEKKWFFWKIWEWLWNMRSDVTSWDKWKEQPWKNLLYAAWVWITWYAVYKWVKKLRNRAFWKDKDKNKSKDKEEEKKDKENDKDKNETSWWKKFLIWAWIATWTVVWWVEIYKNRNRISSWVKEKLGKALNFDEAMYTVESEVRNWINSDDNFWEFSAHFEWMSYDENSQEISSFWQKTKINKSNKTIEWEEMSDVQFASWEELFHAVNIVNFAKRELKWRWANESPFTVNKRTWDIDFNLSESWKTQFIGANWSNFRTKVLGLWWAWWCWLLWWYFLWLKWWLIWATAWWLAWYTLWSVIDNTSTMGRACGTIAKWANLQKFVNYLNKQNIWWEQEEVYEPDDTTPIHKFLNEVKKEIDDTHGDEDSTKRNLRIERNESNPKEYTVSSYDHELKIIVEWWSTKKWESLDFNKIKKIHIEKYEEYDSRWDGLDIDFPHTEEWLKEAIRVANLTNKNVEDWKWKWWESYPFAYGKYVSWNNIAAFNFDIDTPGMWSNWQWWTCILTHDKLKKRYPTILKDLGKYNRWTLTWIQEKMHDQANQDKSEWSQYIKFLHQIGKWKFWKKVW